MRRLCHIVPALALVVLFLLVKATAEVDEDGYEYVPREGGEEREMETDDHAASDGYYSSLGEEEEYSNGGGGELAKLSREDQIAVLGEELDLIRRNEVQPALSRVSKAQQMYSQARANSGWIKSDGEKRRIHSLEQELNQATNALAKAQSKEIELHDRMKPLYGIVSYEFMQEQQATIQGSLKKVNQLAYDNAWWSSIFNSGRAESFTDLIVQFLMQWLMSYILMYPFAVAYYALWSAPWSIYAYSSGASDVVPGLMAWVTGTVIMVLPLAVLAGSAYWIIKTKGPEWARQAEQRRQQQQRYHDQYRQNQQDYYRRLQEQQQYRR